MPADTEFHPAEDRPSAPPVVDLRGVSVSMQSVLALENVSLAVQPGEFLAVLGPNGSGKTTLLKAIAGLARLEAGELRVFGQPVAALGKARRRIGYLPQSSTLNARFPVSARQVVMMARYAAVGPGRFPGGADRSAVERALERVEALEFAEKPIGRLSVGQRQRVYLARALVNDPSLLLLDEPTTAMDQEVEEQFYRTLQEMHRVGTTILIASHDIGVISAFVDRVACLNRRLVAHGKPDAVINEGVLHEMYGHDAMLFTHGGSPHMVVHRHK